MAGSGDLYDLMAEWFAVCLTALEDTPGGVPDCAYIAEGPPAWDVCPCMIIYCGGPDLGQTFPLQPALAPMHRVTIQGEVNLITLTATVLRCAAILGEDGTLPQPSEHEAAARNTSADLWAIWNHTRQAKKNETLFAPRTREFAFDPAVAVNPAGGCAGWQISIRTQLGGYVPS